MPVVTIADGSCLIKTWYTNGNLRSTATQSNTRVVSKQDDRPATVKSSQKNPRKWRDPLGYHRDIQYVVHDKGESKYKQADWYGSAVGYGNMYSFDLTLPPFDLTLKSRAEVGALLKLKDQKINLAQAWGERKQTIGLVTDSVLDMVSLARAIRKLLRGNERELRRELRRLGKKFRRFNPAKSFSEAWLQYSYGWKPLLSDIHGAVQALSDKEREKNLQYRVSVKKLSKAQVETTSTVNCLRWAVNSTHTATLRTKTDYGCFVRLDFLLDSDVLKTLSETGISDPATLAWELLPWSFAVDWVVPVGDWLMARSATKGFLFSAGSYTHWLEQGRTVKNPKGSGYSGSWEGYAYCKRMLRGIYTSAPSPVLVRKPSWLGGEPEQRLLTAISLLRGLLHGGGVPR